MANLSKRERVVFEELLEMESGYVLDFSNRTFSEFIRDIINIDIYNDHGYINDCSKANKLRQIWEQESDEVVGKLMNAMLDHYESNQRVQVSYQTIEELRDVCLRLITKISDRTRRDIFDLFTIGIQRGDEVIEMSYAGRLEDIDFLKRLYDLQSLPSTDSRFGNAEGDIRQHTINNDDWEYGWVFTDNRFQLSKGEDKYFLDFICEVFHPVVRNEKSRWRDFLDLINQQLKKDGYELYEEDTHVSGHAFYGWREIGTNVTMLTQSESIIKKFNTEYVRNEIKMMNRYIETQPNVAIGKAKQLIETCCKTILDEQSITYENAKKGRNLDFSKLLKTACNSIGLAPDKVEHKSAKQVLQNLTNIAQGMAELRNEFGDGHGRNKNFRNLPPRYAELAVGASVTAVHFIWETYQLRKKQSKDEVL
jgi:hypothetical protein